MELAIWDQILDKAVCVSLYANALEKGMNPFVLPPPMSKATNQGRKKKPSEFKPALLHLKIDLVSNPAHSGEGVILLSSEHPNWSCTVKKRWPCVTSCSCWKSWINAYRHTNIIIYIYIYIYISHRRNLVIWIDWVLWHINFCRSFNTKSFLYMYI